MAELQGTAQSFGAAAGGDAGARSTRGALAALLLSTMLSSLGISIANVALPALAASFDAPFHAVQWVVLAYLLAVATLIVSAGRLGDLFGRRRVLLAGIVAYTAASILCAAAPALWLLAAARAVQGIGAAAMMALAMAMVGEVAAKEKAGRATGLLGTMSAVGTALGPSLGGMLIAAAGWQAIFLVKLPLCLAALLLAWRHLPLDRSGANATRPGFDVPGTIVLGITLAAYALAATAAAGPAPANALLLLAAVGGCLLFIRIERRAPAPLVQLAMLRHPALRAGLVTSALVSSVLMATLVVGPFYLAGTLGLDPATVGLVVSVGPVVVALTGMPAGRLTDRFGAQRIALSGLIGIAAGAFGLSMAPMAGGLAGYVGSIVVTTAGYALFQTANNTAVMAGIAQDRRGAVSGMLNLSRNLGLVTGASVLGAVFAAQGMQVTFAVAAALAVLAIAIARLGSGREA